MKSIGASVQATALHHAGSGKVKFVSLHPVLPLVLSIEDRDNVVTLSDWSRGEVDFTLRPPSPSTSITDAIFMDNETLAFWNNIFVPPQVPSQPKIVLCADCGIFLLNLPLDKHSPPETSLTLIPNDAIRQNPSSSITALPITHHILAVAGGDATIRFYDINNRVLVKTLNGPSGGRQGTSVYPSPDLAKAGSVTHLLPLHPYLSRADHSRAVLSQSSLDSNKYLSILCVHDSGVGFVYVLDVVGNIVSGSRKGKIVDLHKHPSPSYDKRTDTISIHLKGGTIGIFKSDCTSVTKVPLPQSSHCFARSLSSHFPPNTFIHAEKSSTTILTTENLKIHLPVKGKLYALGTTAYDERVVAAGTNSGLLVARYDVGGCCVSGNIYVDGSGDIVSIDEAKRSSTGGGVGGIRKSLIPSPSGQYFVIIDGLAGTYEVFSSDHNRITSGKASEFAWVGFSDAFALLRLEERIVAEKSKSGLFSRKKNAEDDEGDKIIPASVTVYGVKGEVQGEVFTRGTPSGLHGGPLLLISNEAGSALFYDRVGDRFKSVGATIPTPDKISWSGDAKMVCLAVEGRLFFYRAGSKWIFLGDVAFGGVGGREVWGRAFDLTWVGEGAIVVSGAGFIEMCIVAETAVEVFQLGRVGTAKDGKWIGVGYAEVLGLDGRNVILFDRMKDQQLALEVDDVRCKVALLWLAGESQRAQELMEKEKIDEDLLIKACKK